ncbi:hypothetical protein ALC57_14308 [Trachymyrmex cornetzi]|uniref:Uncharacterized protein n=1 Tax=Trachymyrmex cornetzi TaxID=471704 RepID=A0A151IYF4_9HYME|nr:hypothetical protein ALC57_14308 [Trachymyrmex cornetzi]
MMYVMLSPYLLHEIGSRNISLIGSNRTCYAVRRRLSYSFNLPKSKSRSASGTRFFKT